VTPYLAAIITVAVLAAIRGGISWRGRRMASSKGKRP
jgi:hypothetical protein